MKKNTLFLLLLVSSYVFAEKSYTISKTETPIIIDGSIDEVAWANANPISDFLEVMPGENVSPIVQTEVKALFDSKYLYISFKAFDDPDLVRAHISKRDDIFSDDMVGIILDTQNDGVMGNLFMSNPFGNQADGQKMIGTEKMDWDAIWSSKGQLTQDGFEVEMAIPFSSLRFQKSEKYHWRIAFFRTISRSDSRRQVSWTPYDRNNGCELCQIGHLYGLEGIDGRAPIDLLPSVTGFQSDDTFDSHFGVGMKIPLGTNLTAEVTLNPDFSQIESDQARIDVNNRAALSYPESRPFFNEGVDLFNTGSFGWKPKVRTVYTRSINSPKVAAKIMGQFGKTQFGYLGAQDEDTYLITPFKEFGATVGVGESKSNILRIKHPLKPGSYIGGIATDRRYGDGSSQTVGADGVFRFGNKWNFDWQYFMSSTQELVNNKLSDESGLTGGYFGDNNFTTDLDGESFDGTAMYAALERRGRNWGGTLMHVTKSPTFRVDNGYLSLNDKKQMSGNMYRQFWPGNEYVEHIFTLVGLGRVFDYSGDEWYEDWLYATISGKLKGQNNISIDFMPNSEFYGGDTFKNNYHLSLNWNSKYSEKVNFGLTPSTGREIIRDPSNPFQAMNKSMSFWLNYKPDEKLSIKPFIVYSRSVLEETDEEIYSVLIGRLRCSYQFSAATNFRVVTEYQDYYKTLDIQPLLSYQPNPFTIFYIGASLQYENTDQWRSTTSQAYMKFQYLFSI